MRIKALKALIILFFVSAASCAKGESYRITKTFISYRYKLEDCADIHGQDIYREIWFALYEGDSYKDYVDLSFDKTFLELRVDIDDLGNAVGQGTISMANATGGFFIDHLSFSYYGVKTDTIGGYIVSDLPDSFGRFVFCIYWCRVNYSFTIPNDGRKIELTLHFRRGEELPHPGVFDQ